MKWYHSSKSIFSPRGPGVYKDELARPLLLFPILNLLCISLQLSTQIQVCRNLLTVCLNTHHHWQESLLPSVCLKTPIILPWLLSLFLKVLISELTTLTGELLAVWLTPLTILMFDTSVNITLSSALPLHPSTPYSAQDPIDLNFLIQITVTLSW